jgi:precorrin isomerase
VQSKEEATERVLGRSEAMLSTAKLFLSIVQLVVGNSPCAAPTMAKLVYKSHKEDPIKIVTKPLNGTT